MKANLIDDNREMIEAWLAAASITKLLQRTDFHMRNSPKSVDSRRINMNGYGSLLNNFNTLQTHHVESVLSWLPNMALHLFAT